MMKKLLFANLLVLILLANSLTAQNFFKGKNAKRFIDAAENIKINDKSNSLSFIKFQKSKGLDLNNLNDFIQCIYQNQDIAYRLINQTDDHLKNTHYRYLLTYKNINLQNAMFIVHTNNQKIYSINGNLPAKIIIENDIVITKETAIQQTLKSIAAQRYKWEMPEEENLLKRENNNPNATYYPKAELVLFQKPDETKYNYAYVFDIYADKPLKRADYYIDASNGNILFENNKIHQADSNGTAITKFSGTQSIVSNYTGTQFTLRETSRGLGIETYNMQTTTNYGSAVDFTDADNMWNNINTQKDEVATDAHWSAEKTWDFFWNKFKRNSIDGQGFKLKSYVHYDVNYANAFWDGQRMTFGDGNASWQPLVALDISAHEITHGLTSFTANLDYSYESGALNEAYSDIFGSSIEFYAKPSQANWLIGENIGTPIRSMSNPNLYSQPDTYLGNNWYSGSQDYGGVHTNSGVLNYWFYLLSVGGSGTNDNGDSFNITGISVDSAAAIAFRTLTVYLTNTSQYADARFYSIQSAIDLFGPCSQQVITTTKAFYAVGVGNNYVAGVQSNFTSENAIFCQAPATVNFVNQSNNANNFVWDFGDGTYSSLFNPSHTYNSLGTYTVKLVSNGGNCGIDSNIKTQYVSILASNPCIINMPATGTNTMTACTGTIYDNGGSSNYSDNSISTTFIKAVGASSITLNFTSFALENGYDYLYIYDGPSTSSPLIGTFTGNNLPNGGSITSTTNRITLKMTSDEGTTAAGFVASWQCNMPTTPPVCNFTVSDSNSCVGQISFTDISLNGPMNWSWDFGDGNTSNLQDPIHLYLNNGTYNVKLTVNNTVGGDSVIKTNYIIVNKPSDPIKPNDTANCGPAAFTFQTNGNGIKWYDQLNASQAFDTGNMITTAVINASSTIYVEREFQGSSIYGGKTDNSGGGSYFNNTNQHFLQFNCYQPTILKSVKVYAASAGNRTITLQDLQGNILASKTVNIPVGSSRVYLNFNIPVSNDLKLVGPPSPNLYRNNAGCNYPYQIGNALSITKCSATQSPTGFYYFFYDWEIQDEACKSNRLPIHITINTTSPTTIFSESINNLDINFINQSVEANSYLWNFGDGNSSSLPNPTHSYTNYGNYDVKLISTNACGSDSVTKTLNLSLDINQYSIDNQIKIFPNPASDILNIELLNQEGFNCNLQLIDVYGKNLLSEKIIISDKFQTHKLKISDLKSGVYFIKIILTNKTLTKVLIIK